MYLEQELESLKAVLEIKNEKLHQQDIKLMKMEKLVSIPWVWHAGAVSLTCVPIMNLGWTDLNARINSFCLKGNRNS